MPNWCHNTLNVQGEEGPLAAFVEKAKPSKASVRAMWARDTSDERPSFAKFFEEAVAEQPLSFASFLPEPSEQELAKLETFRPCTMCGAHGTLPESEAQAEERGARWYPWMDPAEREERTCNACSGTKQERVGSPGWYEWRCTAWGTKWDASFSGPFMALGDGDSMDVEASTEAQGGTVTPTVAIYKFDTAWSPPEPVVQAMSEQHPELEFVLRFGEVGHGVAGEVKYVSGVMVEREDLEIEDVLAPEEMWF